MKPGKVGLYIIVVFLVVTGCKKETTTKTIVADDSVAQSTVASDDIFVNDEIDQAIDEAVSTLSECKPTSGGNVNTVTVQGAVVDTSQVDSGIVNVYYYAKETDTNRARTGSVEIQLPVVNKKVIPWTKSGVTATLTFTAYEINYLNTNTSVWIEGSITVTNYGGIFVNSLVPGDSLVEKVRGSIQYTYNDNGAVLLLYQWNLNKVRVLSVNNNSNVIVTTRGDTTVNGYSNLSNWGITRFSQNYYTTITSPVVQNISASSFYNALSGTKVLEGIPEPITITPGVNQQGSPMASSPYGFLINWTNSSGAQQMVVGYLH